ncbi:DUF6318 family protein [Rothia sp. ARF10]|nr:DUF6318 family protein [Rothia sp. ARF10]
MTLAVVALGLTACGDKDEPTQSSSPTPTASASVSSSSASPSASASPSGSASATAAAEVPAAARARTEAGAIAFLKFYFDEVNRGQLRPGTVDLAPLSEKDCIACKNLQGSLQEYVDNGWSVKQAPVRLLSPAVATDVAGEKVILNFTFEQLPVPYFKAGAEVGKLKAAKGKRAAAIRWIDGAWEMYGMEKT